MTSFCFIIIFFLFFNGFVYCCSDWLFGSDVAAIWSVKSSDSGHL